MRTLHRVGVDVRCRVARRYDFLVEVVDALLIFVEIGAGDADVARARRELRRVDDAGMEDPGVAGVELVLVDLVQIGGTVLLAALALPYPDIGVTERLPVVMDANLA
jgi:hypothetical protein